MGLDWNTRYFVGCELSTWGLLLLFSGIHTFITISLLPASFQIFDASIAVRSALTSMENAYAAADAANTQLSLSNVGSLLVQSTPANSSLSVTAYDSPTTAAARVNILTTRYQYASVVMAKTQTTLTFPSALENVYTPVALQTATNKYDIRLQVQTSTGLLASGMPMSPPIYYSSPKAYSYDATTAVQITGSAASIWKTAAQHNTKIVTSTFVRQEVFAAFFFFQSIVSIAYFFYLIVCNASSKPPTFGLIFVGIGFIFMFIAYATGYFNNGIVSITTTSLPFLLSSSKIGNYLAQPYITILNLLYPLMAVYNTYALKINN